MCAPTLPLKPSRDSSSGSREWCAGGMPKRGKREDSHHFLAIRVTQNLTRLLHPVECAMVPVPTRYDDGDVTTMYKELVDELNGIGPDKYEVITVVSVHKPSKSSAFLKLLSIIPEAHQSSSTMESKLERLFTTNALFIDPVYNPMAPPFRPTIGEVCEFRL